jgi:hypothetical protein
MTNIDSVQRSYESLFPVSEAAKKLEVSIHDAKKFDRFEKQTTVDAVASDAMKKMSPIDQYKYMDNPQKYMETAKLKNNPGDPYGTLAAANSVIRKALLPPVISNPDRSELMQALQLKQLAESRLDKAA